MRAVVSYTGTELPVITVEGTILKRGEVLHYVTPTALKEIKTLSLGYSGGSHGVSVPLPIKIGGFPIRYRVGQSRGHVVKHDELQETFRGELLVANQRVFLNPVAGFKPVSVPLAKIATFHVYANGLVLWQDGKERPYLFVLDRARARYAGCV